MFIFFYISFISRYQPGLSGAVSLTALHFVTSYRVLLVAICWFTTIFTRMSTHSVCPTLMCKITVGSTATASATIPVFFVRRVLLVRGNCIGCHGIHVFHNLGRLHSIDVFHGALQHIAAS